MNKIRITVTKLDISQGKPDSQKSCPIALAIQRSLLPSELYVKSLGAIIENKYFSFPETAVQFIRDFDDLNYIDVKPFSFMLGGVK